jgi:O-antigen ligase
MIELAPYDSAGESRSVNTLALVFALLLGALSIAALRWHATLLIAAALTGAAAVLWAASYTRSHIQWLPLAMLLSEVIPSITLVDDALRPALRYGLIFLFCLPAIPGVWRSGLLRQGGFRLYLIYFGVAAVSVTYSLIPMYSLSRLFGAVMLFGATCAVAAEVRDDRDIQRIFGIFWLGCALVSVMLLVAVFTFPSDLSWVADEWSKSPVRFAGIFGSPNQVGEMALPTIASGLLYWPAASRRIRAAIAASFALMLTFDVMADSRSAFVALAIGVMLYTVAHYRWRAVAAWMLAVIIGIGVVSRLSPEKLEYVNRGDVTTLTGRTDIWRFTIQKIKQSPLLGYGYEVEGQIFQDRYFPLRGDLWDLGPRISTHNGYLARAAGVGIPATLLWLFLTLRPLLAALKGKGAFRLADAVLLGAVPVLILTLDESAAADCRFSIGLLLVMVWAFAERSRLLAAQRDAEQLKTLGMQTLGTGTA